MTIGKPRFAIMGSGGVGGFFGAALARAGYDTTFIARGRHLDAMRENGLRIEGPDDSFSLAPVTATDDPQEIGPVDFVLFAVKAWDTETSGAACRPLIGPDTAVVPLLNGVESEDVLDALFSGHVIGGVAEISSALAAPGLIRRFSPFKRIRFGELDGARTARCESLAAALIGAGIEIEHTSDVRAAIWRKFVFLVGLSAMTALTRRPIGDVRDDPDLRGLLEQVMTEVTDVATAKDIVLDGDLIGQLMQFIDELPAGMRASMAADLDEGRRLELPWLSGAVVRLGRGLGVQVPANAFVCAALKLHEMGAPPQSGASGA